MDVTAVVEDSVFVRQVARASLEQRRDQCGLASAGPAGNHDGPTTPLHDAGVDEAMTDR